jgi:hypothetical protein
MLSIIDYMVVVRRVALNGLSGSAKLGSTDGAPIFLKFILMLKREEGVYLLK